MILTVDIGNTGINCGVFDGAELIKKVNLPSDIDMEVQEYISLFGSKLGDVFFDGAIISSVVDELTNRIQYAILAKYGVKSHLLSVNSNLPIKINLKGKNELGSDRIANAVIGFELFKKAVIVVDLGTATTFDIVNSNGEFVGGLIAPGVETQLKSLYKSTSKLPEIQPTKVDTSVGDTTKDAILAGVIRGTACMIDGMLKQSITELAEDAAIVLTGGLSELVYQYMETKADLLDKDVTLKGLYHIYLQNQSSQPVFVLEKQS